MQKKMMKALRDLNAYVDNDREKLCDRIKNLELSHNRMRRLLNMSKVFVESFRFYACPADLWKEAEYLHKRITSELYGLENYKGLNNG